MLPKQNKQKPRSESSESDKRYSLGEILNAIPIPVTGNPKASLISASHIGRQNLTIRMQLRRFTRLTNAFSKKLENRKAALALHFAWYNFCRVHSTLRETPAMAAGVSSEIWGVKNSLNWGGNMENSPCPICGHPLDIIIRSEERRVGKECRL